MGSTTSAFDSFFSFAAFASLSAFTFSASAKSSSFFFAVFFFASSAANASASSFFFAVFFLAPASRSIFPKIFGESIPDFAFITSGSAGVSSSFLAFTVFFAVLEADCLIASKLAFKLSSLSGSTSATRDSSRVVFVSMVMVSRFSFSRVISCASDFTNLSGAYFSCNMP